ncbi:hypothetical protein D3C77_183810 [compost metagenome]
MEGDGQHPFLHVVELQHPRQQQGADVGDGGADRMPLLAIEIPEDDGRGPAGQGQAHLAGALGEPLGPARLADPRQVALHIGAEDRDAGVREALGQDLQSHRLACAGGAGDHAVAVGAVLQQPLRRALEGLAEKQGGGVGHEGSPGGRAIGLGHA